MILQIVLFVCTLDAPRDGRAYFEEARPSEPVVSSLSPARQVGGFGPRLSWGYSPMRVGDGHHEHLVPTLNAAKDLLRKFGWMKFGAYEYMDKVLLAEGLFYLLYAIDDFYVFNDDNSTPMRSDGNYLWWPSEVRTAMNRLWDLADDLMQRWHLEHLTNRTDTEWLLWSDDFFEEKVRIREDPNYVPKLKFKAPAAVELKKFEIKEVDTFDLQSSIEMLEAAFPKADLPATPVRSTSEGSGSIVGVVYARRLDGRGEDPIELLQCRRHVLSHPATSEDPLLLCYYYTPKGTWIRHSGEPCPEDGEWAEGYAEADAPSVVFDFAQSLGLGSLPIELEPYRRYGESKEFHLWVTYQSKPTDSFGPDYPPDARKYLCPACDAECYLQAIRCWQCKRQRESRDGAAGGAARAESNRQRLPKSNGSEQNAILGTSMQRDEERAGSVAVPHDTRSGAGETDLTSVGLTTSTIDYKRFATSLSRRGKGMKNRAALVEYMADRDSAKYSEIKREVHDNPYVTDDAVRANVSRTNDDLIELEAPFSFRVATGYVHKVISPK